MTNNKFTSDEEFMKILEAFVAGLITAHKNKEPYIISGVMKLDGKNLTNNIISINVNEEILKVFNDNTQVLTDFIQNKVINKTAEEIKKETKPKKGKEASIEKNEDGSIKINFK